MLRWIEKGTYVRMSAMKPKKKKNMAFVVSGGL